MSYEEVYALWQYMECSTTFDNIDKRLRYVCLKCGTDDKINHIWGRESVRRRVLLLSENDLG